MNKKNFTERVYEIVRQVPKGSVTTYKKIGMIMNSRAYQAIGQALRRNPYAPAVPCHRVVASDMRVGGFMGKNEGVEIWKKIALLKSEGVEVRKGVVVKSNLWPE